MVTKCVLLIALTRRFQFPACHAAELEMDRQQGWLPDFLRIGVYNGSFVV